MGLFLERRCDCRSRGRTAENARIVRIPETMHYLASLSIAQLLPLFKLVLAVQCVHSSGLFFREATTRLSSDALPIKYIVGDADARLTCPLSRVKRTCADSRDMSPNDRKRTSGGIRVSGDYGILGALVLDQSGFAPENMTTLAHFSVSATIILPKSSGEPASVMPPRSAKRAFNLGSASPALISLLSLSTISAGVAFGAPMPRNALAS